MFKIGNIVHKEPLINHKQLSHVNYYSNHLEVENKLPTLIIGWNSYKSIVGQMNPTFEVDILNKHIVDMNYWEFSPSEDIIQYSKGIENFVLKLPEYYIKTFMYVNLDPFFYNLYTVDELRSYLPSNGHLYVYKNDMAYYRSGDVIFGIKLSIYDYLGQDVQTIVQTLSANSEKSVIDDGTEYQKYYKMFPEFPLLKRSMVVFLFS